MRELRNGYSVKIGMRSVMCHIYPVQHMFWLNYLQITLMLLIHNQIFIEEKRAHIFRKTSLSRGKKEGVRFSELPGMCGTGRKENYKFPAAARVFSLSISAGHFRAYVRRTGKTSVGQSAHNARLARIRFRRGAQRKKRNDRGIAVDVYRELKGSKGMDVFRANGETSNP